MEKEPADEPQPQPADEIAVPEARGFIPQATMPKATTTPRVDARRVAPFRLPVRAQTSGPEHAALRRGGSGEEIEHREDHVH
jgi:hypothetical protein